jgi:hypothetical protein
MVVGAAGAQGCNDASSPPCSNKNVNIYIYIYINICFLLLSSEAREKRRERGSVPWTGVGVQRLLQAHQDEGDYRLGLLGCLHKLGNVLNGQQAHVDQDAGHPHVTYRPLQEAS